MEVYFSGDFSGQVKEGRAGAAIPIRKQVSYGDYEWQIPAAYSCGPGLVLDVLRKIPPEEVAAFHRKWGRRPQSKLSREESARRRRENPMAFPITFEAELNGRKMESKGFIGIGWQKAEEKCDGPDEKALMELYDLDQDFAWYCCRARFLWPAQKEEEIRSLILVFKTEFCEYHSGCCFDASAGCRPFKTAFTHPTTGQEMQLHVLSCVQKQMDEKLFQGSAEMRGLKFPEHYLEMEYYVEPDESGPGVIRVGDCAFSDSPILLKKNGRMSAAAVGVIGGAQGITSIRIDREGKGEESEEKCGAQVRQLAFSSLHFEPPVQARWYVSVHRKPFESMPVTLIEP